MTEKMYIVVRADLPVGLQMAQVAHAAFEFGAHNPDIVSEWLAKNYLIILQVQTESELCDLRLDALMKDIPHHLVYEPDINGFTALALGPYAATRKLLADLPLAGRVLA